MHHAGDITIHNAADAARYAHVTSIGGGLDIDADAQLPALTSVGGTLYINADAQLPALTSVGGTLYIDADAQLPALASAGGLQSSQPVLVLRRRWTVVIGDTHMHIGCETHTHAEWAAFDDARINKMAVGALRFWREHKDALLALAAARNAKEAA